MPEKKKGGGPLYESEAKCSKCNEWTFVYAFCNSAAGTAWTKHGGIAGRTFLWKCCQCDHWITVKSPVGRLDAPASSTMTKWQIFQPESSPPSRPKEMKKEKKSKARVNTKKSEKKAAPSSSSSASSPLTTQSRGPLYENEAKCSTCKEWTYVYAYCNRAAGTAATRHGPVQGKTFEWECSQCDNRFITVKSPVGNLDAPASSTLKKWRLFQPESSKPKEVKKEKKSKAGANTKKSEKKAAPSSSSSSSSSSTTPVADRGPLYENEAKCSTCKEWTYVYAYCNRAAGTAATRHGPVQGKTFEWECSQCDNRFITVKSPVGNLDAPASSTLKKWRLFQPESSKEKKARAPPKKSASPRKKKKKKTEEARTAAGATHPVVARAIAVTAELTAIYEDHGEWPNGIDEFFRRVRTLEDCRSDTEDGKKRKPGKDTDKDKDKDTDTDKDKDASRRKTSSKKRNSADCDPPHDQLEATMSMKRRRISAAAASASVGKGEEPNQSFGRLACAGGQDTKHTLFLNAAGEVMSCGFRIVKPHSMHRKGEDDHPDFPQLGHGRGFLRQEMFKAIDTLKDKKVVQVSAAHRHSLVLTEGGDVFSFGCGADGALGYENEGYQYMPKEVKFAKGPDEGDGGGRAVQVSAGRHHSLVLMASGAVFSFGRGREGQLGHGNKQVDQHRAKQIDALKGKKVVQVAAGGKHSLVLTETGDVYSFGIGQYGNLGHENGDGQHAPKLVEALKGEMVVQMSAGRSHSLVLTKTGDVYSFGSGGYGSKGLRRGPGTPTLIESLRSWNAVQVSAGDCHSLVLSKSGEVCSFGSGDYGRLGHGNWTAQHEPTFLAGPLKGKRVVEVEAGCEQSVVRTADGRVFLFGRTFLDHESMPDPASIGKKKVPPKVLGTCYLRPQQIYPLLRSEDGEIKKQWRAATLYGTD